MRETPCEEDASYDGEEREEDTGDKLSALRRDGSSKWRHAPHTVAAVGAVRQAAGSWRARGCTVR